MTITRTRATINTFASLMTAAAVTEYRRTTAKNWNFATRESYKSPIAKCFCTDHTGKMSGVISISTSVALNARCQARAKDPDSICHYCFAAAMLEQYSDLGKKLANNTALLTARELEPAEIPVINAEKWPMLRFESFGDLNNIVQVYNYFLIAAVNHKCKAALWTKNPDIIAAALDHYGIEKPKNLVILYSSPKVNEPAADIRERYPFIDKVFTVYDPEYIEAHQVKINCGARDCRKCGRCYSKRTAADVREMLK